MTDLLKIALPFIFLLFFYFTAAPNIKVNTPKNTIINNNVLGETSERKDKPKTSVFLKIIQPTLDIYNDLRDINKKEVDEKYCVNLPILLYHHIQPMERASKYNAQYLSVEPDTFEKQMAYLSTNGYKTIKIEELVKALKEKKALPEKSFIITFDDGYSDINEFALPIAKKFNFDINLAIPTAFIGKSGYLSWEDLNKMIESKNAHILSHGVNHISLENQSMEVIVKELSESKQLLENNLKKFTPVFTYPVGSFGDSVVSQLSNIGYISALSTINGTVQCDQHIFALQRIRIGNMPMEQYGL